jgi:hypothetical protein
MTDSRNNNRSSNHEKAVRWFKKLQYENKESKGKSGEQIQKNDADMHMDMVIAPIQEAYERGNLLRKHSDRYITHT